MYGSLLGYSRWGGYYPRGYLGAGIGYPYMPLVLPYCGLGYPCLGYGGYGYPYI